MFGDAVRPASGIRAVALGVEAAQALVRACPTRSLARAVIGVLTLAARPLVATPYARVNVLPRSCPARPLEHVEGLGDGWQANGVA